MTLPACTALPIARYRFTAVVQQPLPLPDYAGSLLRGQFGAALRQVACMTRQPTCPGCPLLQTCPYTRIFEAPAPANGQHSLQDFSQIPNPYAMKPTAPGARQLEAGAVLVFHLVLVGHTTLAALWPWLWLGQWFHVGKNATMGMGSIALEGYPP